MRLVVPQDGEYWKNGKKVSFNDLSVEEREALKDLHTKYLPLIDKLFYKIRCWFEDRKQSKGVK